MEPDTTGLRILLNSLLPLPIILEAVPIILYNLGVLNILLQATPKCAPVDPQPPPPTSQTEPLTPQTL